MLLRRRSHSPQATGDSTSLRKSGLCCCLLVVRGALAWQPAQVPFAPTSFSGTGSAVLAHDCPRALPAAAAAAPPQLSRGLNKGVLSVGFVFA